jgi:hypothetical protein
MMSEMATNAERQPMRFVDALAFLCEMALLVTLAITGSRLGHEWPVRILLTVALPAIGVTIWSLWMAPTAKRRLDDPLRFFAQVAIFGAAAALAALANLTLLGIAVAVVGIVTFGLTRISSAKG